MRNILAVFLLCCLSIAQTPQWRELKAPKLKQHHNWIYRHPLIVGGLIAGGIGLGIGLTHRGNCRSVYNGFPYNGHENCPTSCDKDGCYWGSEPTK